MILDTPNGDNAAKFALALGAQGNVRTRTARAWPQSEFQKLISEEAVWAAAGPEDSELKVEASDMDGS